MEATGSVLVSASVHEVWEPTLGLRLARNFSHVGHVERLQQGWVCRTNGKTDWRDVPIIDVDN